MVDFAMPWKVATTALRSFLSKSRGTHNQPEPKRANLGVSGT